MQLSDFEPVVPNRDQKYKLDIFNGLYKSLATHILSIEPSNHRTAALRLLLQSKMTLIHGITHPNVE